MLRSVCLDWLLLRPIAFITLQWMEFMNIPIFCSQWIALHRWGSPVFDCIFRFCCLLNLWRLCCRNGVLFFFLRLQDFDRYLELTHWSKCRSSRCPTRITSPETWPNSARITKGNVSGVYALVLQIRDHLSKTPSEKSSDAFCDVENGFEQYPIHYCMGYHENSANSATKADKRSTNLWHPQCRSI